MDARDALVKMATAMDDQQWDGLDALLHPHFTCRYVHTGETFDRRAWVRLNAEYPGFDHLVLLDVVAHGDRGAARCHVTGWTDGTLQHFEVATFVTMVDGLIHEITEVWTDVGNEPPTNSRS